MADKKYVIVTNAYRQTLHKDSFMCAVEVHTSNYRSGELGLIHPAIVDFYSDLENNMKKSPGDERFGGAKLASPPAKPYSDDIALTGMYKHDKRDIPVLLYANLGSIYNPRYSDYLMITLRDREFLPIRGTDLDSVKRAFYMKSKKSAYLEKKIDEVWKHLEAFDILKNNEIHSIPIEVACRYISDEYVKQEEKYLRSLRDCDIRRARSWRDAHYKAVGL